ncbi:MAG: peptidoglycan-binding protein [Rhodobacteraceae bacterium]|nr:peptidoglycan-binding protein [Paracoccaceae bacterium]
MRNLVLAVLFGLVALPLRAENVALLVETRDYRNLPALDDRIVLDQAQGLLVRRGFDVVLARDLPLADLRAELAAIQARLAENATARLIIVISGWFAASESGAWALAADAEPPSLATVDGAGLRLDTIMELASAAPEAAHLWLVEAGSDDLADSRLGTGLRAGLPDRFAVPRGVAVLRGDARAIIAGLDGVLQPGTTLSEALAATRDLRAEGTVPTLVPFLPEGFAPIARADREAWEDARTADTEDGYRAYLGQYPNGLNAQEARDRIEAIRNAPERIEADLALSRDERRAIQRDLTTLGYSTRGIDGLFGPGTRAAITAWQARNDLAQTGFLTRDQIFQLAGQAARRTAELEAEERERRQALERADRAFWEGTGSGRDEAGLRAYLDRYPNGIFATLARERLTALEAETRAEADRAAWARAQSADTLRGYRQYLAAFPDGAFAALARARLQDLRPRPDPLPEAPLAPIPGMAEAEEAALNLPLAVRVLVERRLASLGFDPGMPDGNLDQNSRRAIARAQDRFSLPVTGYLSQPLLDAMLEDVLDGFFR